MEQQSGANGWDFHDAGPDAQARPDDALGDAVLRPRRGLRLASSAGAPAPSAPRSTGTASTTIPTWRTAASGKSGNAARNAEAAQRGRGQPRTRPAWRSPAITSTSGTASATCGTARWTRNPAGRSSPPRSTCTRRWISCTCASRTPTKRSFPNFPATRLVFYPHPTILTEDDG